MRLGFVKWFLVGLSVVVALSGCSSKSSSNIEDEIDKPTVLEPDVIAPVITIIGEETVTISQGDVYTDAGATATDNVDGAVSVVTTESVDTNIVGTYTIKYNAKDSAENVAEEVIRIVNVIDVIAPVITIIGEETVTIYKGDDYDDKGATAIDNVDGAIDVVETGIEDVDVDVVDTYSITYTATDNAGNIAEANRTVIVEEGLKELKKTGQIISYNKAGEEVPHGSIKDDGFYQKGSELSFTRDDNLNIVTDHIAGLQWQDDEEVKTVRKQWLTDENNVTCENNTSSLACLDTTGDTATTYCSDLNLSNYTDWRLPSIDELISIRDNSRLRPAIDTFYFENLANNAFYCSSTTVANMPTEVWFVTFEYGSDAHFKKNIKDYPAGGYAVRCVRDGQ